MYGNVSVFCETFYMFDRVCLYMFELQPKFRKVVEEYTDKNVINPAAADYFKIKCSNTDVIFAGYQKTRGFWISNKRCPAKGYSLIQSDDLEEVVRYIREEL